MSIDVIWCHLILFDFNLILFAMMVMFYHVLQYMFYDICVCILLICVCHVPAAEAFAATRGVQNFRQWHHLRRWPSCPSLWSCRHEWWVGAWKVLASFGIQKLAFRAKADRTHDTHGLENGQCRYSSNYSSGNHRKSIGSRVVNGSSTELPCRFADGFFRRPLCLDQPWPDVMRAVAW